MQEATAAAKVGGQDIDMVVNIGKVRGGGWQYMIQGIDNINRTVVSHGAILKMIFEKKKTISKPSTL